MCPCGNRARKIIGVNGVSGAPSFQFLERPAEVIKHLAVDLLDHTFGRRDADEAGDRIDEQSKALFARAEVVFDTRVLVMLTSGVIGWARSPWRRLVRPG